MITQISFKNFRLFKDKQTIELKPITLLIGKNNTGKSAVLKLMPLIESCLGGKSKEPIDLISSDVLIADFPKEIIYGKANRGLEFDIYKKPTINSKEKDLKITLFADDDDFKIEKWSFNNEIALHSDDDVFIDSHNNILKASFRGFRLDSLVNIKNGNHQIAPPINQLDEYDLFVDFISGIRQEARTNYPYEGKNYEKSGLKGENLYQFLIENSQTTDRKYFNLISEWIREKFEGWELKIEYDGYRKELPALIFLEKGHLKINFSQTGMGISQILPLIIRAYKPCNQETLIVLEEPESHLHPYAHAQIAQLLFESLNLDKKKNYLIETHSQNFILRMRRLVAEGILSPNDLKIYYVDYNENANMSQLKEIKVDERGGVNWWPEGIFGETVLEARKIYNAQINDLRNNVGKNS